MGARRRTGWGKNRVLGEAVVETDTVIKHPKMGIKSINKARYYSFKRKNG